MLSTLLDSTPKDKENLAINGFVCAAPWAKGYLLSNCRNLNRSGRAVGLPLSMSSSVDFTKSVEGKII
jgi:hypothetical protein